jgi:hypothetical protein
VWVTSNQILTSEDAYSVFSNLSELLLCHQQLLGKFKEAFGTWQDSASLGKLFLEQLDFMDRYQPYIHGYNSSFAAVHYLAKKNPQFGNGVQVFEMEQKKTTALNLEAFLIMPVQRLPRYILLLQVYLIV